MTRVLFIAGNKNMSDSKKLRLYVLMWYTCLTTLCLASILYVNKTWKIKL